MFCRTGFMVLVAWTMISAPSGVGAEPMGVVSHVKVLSDKIEDVSSIEAWKRSFIKPGMSDGELRDVRHECRTSNFNPFVSDRNFGPAEIIET